MNIRNLFKQFSSSSLIALSVGLLLICVHAGQAVSTEHSANFVDVLARKNAISVLPQSERTRYCGGGGWNYTPTFSETATITGPIQRQQSNVQQSGDRLYQMVESYYAGNDVGRKIRDALAEAVRINAFNKVKPYHPKELGRSYNGLNEPYFQLASFLAPLAHAYLIVKTEYPDDQQLLDDVKRWGDSLYARTIDGKNSFRGKVRGVDRRALHAHGYAHWGNATSNAKVLDNAFKYYKKGLLSVGRNGRDRIWRFWVKPGQKRNLVYYPNMTYQALLSTAFVLHRSGYEDIYELAPKKGTIVDGVVWLWDRLEENPYDLMNTRHPGTRHVAWLEYFVHEFPDHPSAKKMRKWSESKYNSLYGGLSGGPLTCLYRIID